MINALQKLYKSEKVLVLTGLLFFAVGGVLVVGAGDADADTDADTVVDSLDQCPGTVVDKPLDDLAVNRHIWVGGEYFMTLVPNKGEKDKVQSEFSMMQTKGCSCGDILKVTGKGNESNADYKLGCSNGTIGLWVRK